MKYLVTGAAGFIGFHLTESLLCDGFEVIGFDNMNSYYDVTLKERRLALLGKYERFQFVRSNLEEPGEIDRVLRTQKPDFVIHLAAQAGVRYSLEAPAAYIASNILGTFHLLEACRHTPIKHLMLASTSSAYGANTKYPFEEIDNSIHPITLYAATKASTELIGHCYSHLFSIPTTAFRFFTVYGPWGRPDMAYFSFTQRILNGAPIDVYNEGDCWRDFTFITDLVDSIRHLAMHIPPTQGVDRDGVKPIPGDTLSPVAPYRLVNIGGGKPVKLTQFIDSLEDALGIKATRRLLPLPPGDMIMTYADARLLEALTGQKPSTPLSHGLPDFVRWYRAHMN